MSPFRSLKIIPYLTCPKLTKPASPLVLPILINNSIFPVAQANHFGIILETSLLFKPHMQSIRKSCWPWKATPPSSPSCIITIVFSVLPCFLLCLLCQLRPLQNVDELYPLTDTEIAERLADGLITSCGWDQGYQQERIPTRYIL